MHVSKCLFCRTGIVFDKNCDKVIGHVFCDIDEYDENRNCTPDGCPYYTRPKESEASK